MRWSPILLSMLFVSSAIAGCLGDDSIEVPPVNPAETNALSSFVHTVSVLDENVSILDLTSTQFRIAAPDGIELDTWVVLPPGDGPFPLVLEITPYYGGGDPLQGAHAVGQADEDLGKALHFFFSHGDELLQRGYAVGVSSVRGTGTSGGCFSQGGPGEAVDSATVIESLAAMPWSNGNVGLIGVSYPGTTPQDVWVEAPPSLKTIVPISGISDMYKYNFVNGVPIMVQGFGFNAYYVPYTSIAPVGLGLGIGATDPVGYGTGTLGEACTEQIEVQEGGASSTIDGNKDSYWQVRDFHAELRDSWDRNDERASVLYIHGLQDWNVKPHMMEDWLPALQESGVPFKALLGQWNHNWPQREDWWNVTMVAWFDQFLKDMDTGILDAPAVQVQDDRGVWRHETSWPPADVELLVLQPHSNGTLAPSMGTGTGTVRYHDQNGDIARQQTPMRAAQLQPGYEAAMDETNRQPAFVAFRGEPLAQNMTLSGLPKFIANVTADGQRASLMLTLVEELADGTWHPFNYAAQSLNHVSDLGAGNADVSGIMQTVDVSFFPQDDTLLAGSRIVLVAAGNFVGGAPGPSLQPVSDGGFIALEMEGAQLILPVDWSLEPEQPQPCWEGREPDENGDPIPGTCQLIR